MLIDIDFYDKTPNLHIKVETPDGGLKLSAMIDGELLVVDSAKKLEGTGIYTGVIENNIEKYSDYRIVHDRLYGIKDFNERMEEYKEWGISYGVADDLDQIMSKYKKYLFDPDRLFILNLDLVRKSDQPAHDGWRWHKWGPYIGTQNPVAEYLADEPEIEHVILFSFIELEPE